MTLVTISVTYHRMDERGVLLGLVEFAHEPIIHRHCMYLVENLKVDLSKLVELRVISSEEAHDVEVEQSAQARNYMILKLLLLRKSDDEPDDRFIKFRRFLVITGQIYIYIHIVRGQSVSHQLALRQTLSAF